MQEQSEYLMKYLGMNRTQLSEFLSKPDKPTGNMAPPDSHYEAMQETADAQEPSPTSQTEKP